MEGQGDAVRKRIWDDVDRSGIELEIRAADIFRKKPDWAVSPIHYYVDLDSRKGREIDFSVTYERALEVPAYNLLLDIFVFVECKKIPGNCWAFFPASKNDHYMRFPSSDMLGGGSRANNFEPMFSEIIKKRIEYDAIAIHYKETVFDRRKSNGRIDNLYKGLMSLAKCQAEWMREEGEGVKSGRDECLGDLQESNSLANSEVKKDYSVFDSVAISLSLVVFDGQMFVAKPESRELVKARCVRINLGYRSNKYSIDSLPIDVCSIDYLESYLDQLTSVATDFISIAKAKGYAPNPYGEAKYDKTMSWLENRRAGAVENLSKWAQNGLD